MTTAPRLIRLPFQFIPYGDSFYTTQFPASQPTAAVTNESETTEKSTKARPLLTPSSTPYELLNLQSLGHRATQNDIKRQYKKQAIRYHPDRFGSDAMFKKIQEAYEMLSNEKKRRKHDSSDAEFDIFLETEEWEKPEVATKVQEGGFAAFEKTFGEYFARWSKWSETEVPKFGSEDVSYDDVMQFYDFYEKKFVTWRDYACFDDDDEFDPNDAENSAERRWLERKNKKKHQKKKNYEMKKLRQLIKTARKRDPRIVAHKEALKRQQEEEVERKRKAEEDKRRQQYEKELEEQRQREEKERLAREEEDRKKREQETLEAKHAEYADIIRKAAGPYIKIGLNKNEIKKLEASNELFVFGEDIEMLCMVLNLEQIQKVAEKAQELSSNGEKLTKTLRSVVKQYRQAEEKKRLEAQQKLDEAKQKREQRKAEVAWTNEELAALAKATKLYPSGTRNRWECLANHIGTRDAEEVQRKVGELRKGSAVQEIPKRDHMAEMQARLKQNDDPTQWSVSQQKQLEAGLRTHRALKGDAKWQQIANGVDNKTPEACKARFEYCKELAKKKKGG